MKRCLLSCRRLALLACVTTAGLIGGGDVIGGFGCVFVIVEGEGYLDTRRSIKVQIGRKPDAENDRNMQARSQEQGKSQAIPWLD